jgi:hypothetical protein
MDRAGTPLISKLIFVALLAICVCLVVLIAQNRTRNSPPETAGGQLVVPQETTPADQWDAEPVRLKVTNNLRKPTPRAPLTTPAPQVAASPRQPEAVSTVPDGQYTPPESAAGTVTAEVAPISVITIHGTAMYPAGMPIVGQVLLSGEPPRETPISLDPTCGRYHQKPLTTRHYVVSDSGGLANVWVYVQNATGSFSAPTEEVVLDQAGCEYQPYVFAVMTKQPVRIKNSDPFLHNVNTVTSVHSAHRFNIAQPNQTKADTKRFDRPELPLKFMCNVHPWMLAYAAVFEHPFFAVTDSEGRFEIPAGLPAGRYTLAARHLKAGKILREVEIAGGVSADPLTMTFDLSAH